jgi:pimeloyl-ACP methyl ester carboxylesterase
MYSKLLPNATLKSIDNCGHSPQMEKPDEFNAAMAAFLGEL